MVGTIILLASMTLAVYLDVRYRRLPNWLTTPLALAGLVTGGLTDGLHGLGVSTGGMIALLVVYGIMREFQACRGGDVKLCAALGAWIGIANLTTFLLSWVVFNALAVVVMAFSKNRYSFRDMWDEQKESVQTALVWSWGLLMGGKLNPAGIVSRKGAHTNPGAVAIALSVVSVLILS